MLPPFLLLQTEKSILIGLGILVVATAVFLIYYFSPKSVILRRLKKLPVQRIGSLRTNTYSKIEGKALNVETPLTAPLTKRKCVFYKIKIEKKVSTGKSSHWKTIVDQEQIQDFFIEQNNERVIVFPTKVPKNYFSYVVTDNKTNSGTFKDPTPEFKKLLTFYNIESEDLFGFNRQIRYSEAIVEVGERITIAGIVKWLELERPIADYTYSSIASINGNAKEKILITDNPDALRPKHGRV